MRECPEAACALLDYCSLKPKVMLPGCSWNKDEPYLIAFLVFLTMASWAESEEWSQSIAHSSGLGGHLWRGGNKLVEFTSSFLPPYQNEVSFAPRTWTQGLQSSLNLQNELLAHRFYQTKHH